jgi:dTDP-glucose 4,6-dehydratase
MIFVTGGAGFIGSNFVGTWLREKSDPLLVVDKLTYAGNPENIAAFESDPRLSLQIADICDQARMEELCHQHSPRAIVHFAAESHVDRSIHGPGEFIRTNVNGTFALLQAARSYWDSLAPAARQSFRFLHVSTDEVYGSLSDGDAAFTERTPYSPNSPYSASKAASDHLVRAYHHTYGMPTLTTNCSNNYGPFQFPEKLIPLMILNALEGKPLPVYGDGRNIRDWLYVGDHCAAILKVLNCGRVGEVYNVGGESERRNLEVVEGVCEILDEMRPRPAGRYRELISFVTDRLGHDHRYAIDCTKIRSELGWQPSVTFEEGLRQTVAWYLEHSDWVEHVRSGDYLRWIDQHYRQEELAG